MLIQTNATSGQFPQLWYRLLFTLVALVSIFFVAPCLAQPEDDEPLPPPATIPATKVGQQLKWVLDIVNGGDMGDPKDKFTERFLELVPPKPSRKPLFRPPRKNLRRRQNRPAQSHARRARGHHLRRHPR